MDDSPLVNFLKVAAGLHAKDIDPAGTVDGVRDILLDQRGQNEGAEMQGIGHTRNMTRGPTPNNLRNKQSTDDQERRWPGSKNVVKGPSHYGNQYVTKQLGEETP